MDKILAFLVPILTFITGYYGPIQLAKMQGKTKKEEVKMEGDSNAEVMYVTNMSVILGEYKEQVSGFRNELENVRKEFAEFKKAHKKEVEEYKTSIVFLEREIEIRDDKIEELEAVIIVKDDIIATLKGERSNEKT